MFYTFFLNYFFIQSCSCNSVYSHVYTAASSQVLPTTSTGRSAYLVVSAC